MCAGNIGIGYFRQIAVYGSPFISRCIRCELGKQIIKRIILIFTEPRAVLRHIAEAVGAVAHNAVTSTGKCIVRVFVWIAILRAFIFLRVKKPQGVIFACVINIKHGRSVAFDYKLAVCLICFFAVIYIMLKVFRVAVLGVIGGFYMGIICANRGCCGQIILRVNGLTRIFMFFHRAYIAVIIVIGILQPVRHGVLRVHRFPKRAVIAAFGGNGCRQSGMLLHNLAVIAEQCPAVKHIAVAGRVVHQKRRTVARVNRVCAVAARIVEFKHTVIAVIIAFKNG